LGGIHAAHPSGAGALMAIDHDAREISLFDVMDHVVAWWWLFISFTIAAMVAIAVLYATTVPTYRVDVAVSAYPAIPGTTSGVVDAEISNILGRDFPETVSTKHGYSISVLGHDAATETATAIGVTLDSYETILRNRISVARDRLVADFMKAPNNAAVYEILAQYNAFFDENENVRLISHRESIAARRPIIWVSLIYSSIAGALAAAFLSLLVEAFSSWRRHHI
jgi:hypothetical protein